MTGDCREAQSTKLKAQKNYKIQNKKYKYFEL
jgi:hypothetical protein